ncbi:DUF559 domain-containing protein [bacterium]|nr:DUF559 domain-containing protein [bacterium]
MNDKDAKNYDNQNSPPVLGGVSEGRGGKKQINNQPYLKSYRRKLRNNLTPSEAVLWKMLQHKKLNGKKFRRQHSIDKYILDFYCPEEKLAIELDGQGHFEMAHSEHDVNRSIFLEKNGIKVLRFENKTIFESPEQVLNKIKSNFNGSTS